MKKLMVSMAVLAMSIAANAKVLAWYRFEENPSGTISTGDMVFTNSVDASKYPAYARVCTANGNNKFNPANPTVLTTANTERMPQYTNAFPANVSVYDPVTLEEYANNTAIDTRNLRDTNENPSGLVLIDDHEDLRKKSFTLEFFMRCNDDTKGWRTFVVRTAPQYSTSEAFRLRGQLYPESGAMYVTGTFTSFTTDGETGEKILHQYQLNASSSDAIVDDNLWHHMAITVDNETKEVNIYIDYVKRSGQLTYTETIDGEKVDKKTSVFEGEIHYDEGYPFTFGGDPQCSYFNSNTQFDEIRFSDRALEPSEFLNYGFNRIPNEKNSFVDENTMFFFDFSDPSGSVTAGEGVMKNLETVNPMLVNKATNPLYRKIDAELYTHTQAENYAVPVNSDDTPNAGSRFGILGTGTSENVSSCHITTNGLECTDGKKIVIPQSVTRDELFSGSLTIESYVKIPKKDDQWGFNNQLPSLAHLIAMNNTFTISMGGKPGAWNYGYMVVTFGKTTLRNNGEFASQPTYTKKSYADGNWHHLAFVYDKEADEVRFYVDGEMRLSGEGPFTFDEMNRSYLKTLVIGDSYWDNHFTTGLHIDDVRISRAALRPYEFLTTIPSENAKDAASASFENDFTMEPYTVFFGDEGTPGVFTADGTLPSCVKARPSMVLTRGKKGAEITDANTYSVRINGGKVVYPGRALMCDSSDFTVQFFMKAEETVANAGIARINRNSKTDVSSDVTWALSFADDNGNLVLKVDTDKAANQTRVFNTAVNENGWCHIAMQFMTENGNSIVKLYKDHELVDTWTLDGTIATRPLDMNFMLGAGEDVTAPFNGWIDEFTVTPGFVPASEFVYAVQKGLIILVK